MKKTVKYLLALLIVFEISCDKSKDCPECFSPPQELNLKITDCSTGSDLILNQTITADSIEFFYYINGKKTVLEHEFLVDSANSRTLLVNYEISWKSADGIKVFYLYLGNNDTDTIFLDLEKRNSDCCTYYEWIDFKINDEIINVDTTDYVYNYKKTCSQQ